MTSNTFYQRLQLLCVELEINISQFARNCGFTPQSLSKKKSEGGGMRMDTLIKILKGYKNINALWLLTGEGSMLIVNQDGKLNEPEADYKKICEECESKQRTIDALTKSVNNQDLLIKKCNDELQKFQNSEKRKAV